MSPPGRSGATAPSRLANVFSTLVEVRVCSVPVKFPSFDVSLSWHTRFDSDPGIRWMRDVMVDLFQEGHAPRSAK